VTLVGNDTGGAICQLVVTRHPERLSRLVLTNCDAFENFPPRGFRLLPRLARIPGALTPLLQPARLKTVRRLTYRPFARRRLDDDLLDSWVRPFLSSAEIRRDTTKVTVGIDRRHTLEAGRRLSTFEGEALIAWARRDPFFPFSYAERLAEALPAARLEAIEDSRAFVPLDQPARLAELISAFARS
jgi:pimeloyl-ACP methyl ester carboxylesterase